MIAFPLGGIGTGTVSLGGRGQLRDWEIFNRPDKGNELSYAFPAIWAKVGEREPVARVLESRLQPPYEMNSSGLGSDNAPGLPRLAEATFTGAYPFARIAFADPQLPVEVRLEAFNPLVPLDVDASGWPVAILRYTIRNANNAPARVGIAWSIENPVGKEGRQAAFRQSPRPERLVHGQSLPGGLRSFERLVRVVRRGSAGGQCLLSARVEAGRVVEWRADFLGRLQRRWRAGLHFSGRHARGLPGGDANHSRAGRGGGDLPAGVAFSQSHAGALRLAGSGKCAQDHRGGQRLTKAGVTFLLAWHFPNRTPERCGWPAPEAVPKTTVVGNAYTERFTDAWDASRQAAAQLPQLEARTRAFAQAIESSTLPPAVLDAATSTLSTLRVNTCFRTADGEFHGFEGCNDHQGCCHGSCTHVWNYEQATAQVFPTLAHSLRESEFLRNTDTNGLMGFRSYLPDGKQIWQMAAADGQMGCLIKLYREWRLSRRYGLAAPIVAQRQARFGIRLDRKRLGWEPRRRCRGRSAQHLRRGVLRP